MNSPLNENLIYAAKRALEKVSTIDNGVFTLDLSGLDDIIGVPDQDVLREQILQNFKIHRSQTAYLNRLNGLFPYLHELYEKLLEEIYSAEYSLNDLMVNVGYLVDFSETGPNHFYFGKNYEKLNGADTEERKQSEYLSGSSGTTFSTEAQMYFYYSRGTHPTRDQKPDGDLIFKLECEYHDLTTKIAKLKDLLSIAETIQGTIHQAEQSLQQPAAEAAQQPSTPKNKLNLNDKKGNKAAFYYVLRQLYRREILMNSWPEIASFLIENVTGFEDAEVRTLAAELSRDNDPAAHRRIEIPRNLPELDE